VTKYTADSSNFGADGPFFRVIREGLKGLASGEDYFDLLADDVVFDYVISVPGYPRHVEGRRAVIDLYSGYDDYMTVHAADNLRIYRDPEASVGLSSSRRHHRYVPRPIRWGVPHDCPSRHFTASTAFASVPKGSALPTGSLPHAGGEHRRPVNFGFMAQRGWSPEDADELRAAIGQFVRAGRSHDVVPRPQAAVLGFLDREGPLTIAELAERSQVRHQTMRVTIGVLQDEGAVSVSKSETDGRKVFCALTTVGRDLLDRDRDTRTGWILRGVEQRLNADQQVVAHQIAASSGCSLRSEARMMPPTWHRGPCPRTDPGLSACFLRAEGPGRGGAVQPAGGAWEVPMAMPRPSVCGIAAISSWAGPAPTGMSRAGTSSAVTQTNSRWTPVPGGGLTPA
jgi:uncharacterized protein